jgi:CSLREA domain-containing protein
MQGRLDRAVAVLALIVGVASGAQSATITVDSAADSLAIDGNCTLREAVIAANTDTAVDACPAGSGADIVVVPAGTYTLTLVGTGEDAAATGDLDVTASAELLGSPAGAILDGNGADRVLDVDPAHTGGVIVTLTNVTIRNGAGVAQGGGIRNAGTLTLTGSRVSSSTASGAGEDVEGGGIYNDGSLQLIASTVDGNTTLVSSTSGAAFGGGIHTEGGALVVTDSSIRDNVATLNPSAGPEVAGGGIHCGGSMLTLMRSTVSGNGAVGDPRSGSGLGGGIASCDGAITNSTISGNHAAIGAQIIVAGGTLSFSNSTIDDGISVGVAETLIFRNTIVARCFDLGGGFTTVADDYNLDASDTCQMSGTDLRGVDPLLGPLADNGGPTQTRMPQPGSPAIQAGNPAAPGSGGLACEATDQRGVVRPVGSRCDIGAVESSVTGTTIASTSTTTTSTTSSTTTTLCGPAPQIGCQPALAQKSKLTLKNLPDDTKDRLSWSWTSSAAVLHGSFDDPVAGAIDYVVCLYDQGGLKLDAKAPAGGTCGTKPCWKRTASSKLVYTDKLLDPDGLLKVVLNPGPAAGKAKITVKGNRANLGMPVLPLTTPVRMQILRRFGQFPQGCWDASFSASTRNDAERLSARSDP